MPNVCESPLMGLNKCTVLCLNMVHLKSNSNKTVTFKFHQICTRSVSNPPYRISTLLQRWQSVPFHSSYTRLLFLPNAAALGINATEFSTELTGTQRGTVRGTPSGEHEGPYSSSWQQSLNDFTQNQPCKSASMRC